MRPGTRPGVRFLRTDLGAGVAASWRNVSATRLATVIREGGAEVRTIEHLMSALSALGIADATVEIDGPEVPIMDGSARPFVDALAGAIEPTGVLKAYRVARPVVVREGGAWVALLPHEGRRFDVAIEFADAAIGAQRVTYDVDARTYASQIAPARTFGRLKDVRRLRQRGYARGASLDNAIAVDGARIANEGGLRMDREFARHKLLDAIGDLSLAGRPILGLYRSHKGGHRLNYRLLAALFSSPFNLAEVEAS